MCGICGFNILPGERAESGRILSLMTQALQHRGPDAGGEYVGGAAPPVALGHRRLAIIDVASGAQPMEDATGRVVSYNGEIYNFQELRSELLGLGHTFRTHSDTEVLLASYDQWGEKCVTRFNGMFAFALFDESRQCLFLARDRLGKKPLFYHHEGKRFIFASEIKAILAHPAMRQCAELDLESLSDFLSLGYILSPKTIFRSIRKLPAGHTATLNLSECALKITPYWELDSFFKADKLNSGKVVDEEFKALLEDATRLRMRSDVPLGAFLSGGVDSSAVVACMKKASSSDVRTFCVRFEQESFDESEYAKAVAEHLGVDVTVLTQSMPSANEVAELVWQLDEPFSDTSLVPTYLVCKATKQHATVALSGDGADELFAGYVTYAADEAYRLYARVPGPIQRGMLGLVKSFVRPSYKKLSLDYKLRAFLESQGLSREEAHYSWRNIFRPAEKMRLLSHDALAQLEGYDPFAGFQRYYDETVGLDFLDRSLYVDTKTWLQDDILVKVDRMSMAASLEVRSPFLDHRIVEFAARLPVREKMSFAKRKILLKRCMASALPPVTIKRPKKGFLFPAHLLSGGVLRPKGLGGVLRNDFELEPEKEDVTFKSFSLMVLNVWISMYEKYRQTGKWEPITYGN